MKKCILLSLLTFFACNQNHKVGKRIAEEEKMRIEELTSDGDKKIGRQFLNCLDNDNLDEAFELAKTYPWLWDLECDLGNNILFYAVQKNEGNKIIKYWCQDLGRPVDFENFQCFTPLFEAIRFGNINAVNLLTSFGANIHRINRFGVSAINLAVSWNRLEIFKMLISSDVQLPTDDNSLINLFNDAISCNNFDLVQELFHNRSPLFFFNPKKIFSGRCLICAVKMKNLEIISFLLDKGADVNEPFPSKGQTPLYRSIVENSPKIFFYLIGKGANYDIEIETLSGRKMSLLQIAIDESCDQSIIDFLQDKISTKEQTSLPSIRKSKSTEDKEIVARENKSLLKTKSAVNKTTLPSLTSKSQDKKPIIFRECNQRQFFTYQKRHFAKSMNFNSLEGC